MIYRPLNMSSETGTILPLLAEHAIEVLGSKANLDLVNMFSLIRANLVRVYVVEDNDIILGYSMYLLQMDLFSAKMLQANNVGIYLAKEHRGLKVVRNLIKFSESCLAKEGVKSFLANSNNKPGLAKIYERLGYNVTNVQLKKDI